ncbi:MAG: short-chain dehydrogenase [Flavisolibacter sp.]|nr:short-chain dehydrogenase [Flavisolibacter sp.]
MNSEQIKKFVETKITRTDKYVKIEFSRRDPVYGIFVTDADYEDLSSKNFWRIVTSKNFDAYNKSKDVNLARIFNGSEFSKLSLLSDEF